MVPAARGAALGSALVEGVLTRLGAAGSTCTGPDAASGLSRAVCETIPIRPSQAAPNDGLIRGRDLRGRRECDLGLVGYETARLVERVGGQLTPELVVEMKHAVLQ